MSNHKSQTYVNNESICATEDGRKTPQKLSNVIVKDNYHTITATIKQIKSTWGRKHQKPGTTTPRANQVRKLRK